MIEKPKRPKKIPNQDNKQPQTIQELIRRYDLDNTKIYDFLDEMVLQINSIHKQNTEQFDEIETKIDETVLYKDATGTTGDVHLDEDVTNYEEIEVFGHRVNRPFHIKIDTNRTYINLSQTRCVDNMFYFYTKEYSINGNILSVNYAKLMYLTSDGTPAIGDDTNIYITKVVGLNKK